MHIIHTLTFTVWPHSLFFVENDSIMPQMLLNEQTSQNVLLL